MSEVINHLADMISWGENKVEYCGVFFCFVFFIGVQSLEPSPDEPALFDFCFGIVVAC